MPGTPTIVTSSTEPCSRTRASASTSWSTSRSRPTRGVLDSGVRSTPKRALACATSQTGSGASFPFASTSVCARYSIVSAVARYVVSPTRIPFTGAADCRRAAVLTTSPAAIPSPASGRAARLTSASPVFTAIRTCSSPSSAIQSRIASAARTARSGSSSRVTGAPNSAITASPMNFSTVPPQRSNS